MMKVVVDILLALLVYGICRAIADLSKPSPLAGVRFHQMDDEHEEKSVLLERPQDFEEAIRTMAQDGYEIVSADGLFLTFWRYST